MTNAPHIGMRVVWAGPRPIDDFIPLRLPGTIGDILPDNWIMMRWVDKVGWHDAEAVYEFKHLQEVDDRTFIKLVDDIRASDWTGFPPTPKYDAPPPQFAEGETVKWVGPVRGDDTWVEGEHEWRANALGGDPPRSLPGTVIELSPFSAVRVRWVDRTGEFEGREFIRSDLVQRISRQEFEALAEELRDSGWPGLEHNPGAHL